ncbi:hypothetical protein, partial [Geobacillus stearothermophilus]|uniref:hypothetical protein n=1 Tax=Geobacillus stearothermophilus TaxID=1422 RepID=UPI002E1DE12D|nr:hypothetical protein [Geobacillus stearothermophilus]
RKCGDAALRHAKASCPAKETNLDGCVFFLLPSRNVDVSRLFGPSGVSKKYFSTKSLTSFFSFVDILQT